MAKVRSKDTGPEMILRRRLHQLGYRFRLHRGDLPGRPDIVFASRRKAIFVHGCFWHRHEGCRLASTPKSRVEFWTAKFRANAERDARNLAEFSFLGWDSLVVWECETRKPDALIERVMSFLGPPGRAASR